MILDRLVDRIKMMFYLKISDDDSNSGQLSQPKHNDWFVNLSGFILWLGNCAHYTF